MNDKEILKKLYQLPPPKTDPRKQGNQSIKQRIIGWYWKLKHLFGCEERYLTRPDFIRYCHKCGRTLVRDPELRKAFRKGGMPAMVEKAKQIRARKLQETGAGEPKVEKYH